MDSTLLAQLGRPGDAGKDLSREILGTWEGFMADPDGSPHGQVKLEITVDTITASTYKVSGDTNKLKRIDAKGTSGQFQGKNYEGVFTIEGKTLKWCSANDNPRSKSPDELKTNVQQGQFLMVLEKK